ncbi:head GIN domain-containing protein [Rhizosphaericola mali]|uniref:DUF2807 domain-containing protein n=1 Tax=Rhizosphaericola mali TaxID=2545455 RepID=A0A5P2GBQ4_9BACT|nr:head GIN domain-containing protein [Rhizosphaericola mali]QES90643.1 DUF2807 domain-containing protein [Rhizosphaericola mali]
MKIVATLSLSALLFASCFNFNGKRVKGNGNIATLTKSVNEFHNVDLSGTFDIYLTQGPTAPVKIEGDDNIISHIKITQTGDKLELGTEDGFKYSTSKSIKVYLTSPQFKSIDVSGAGDIKGTNQLTSNDELSVSTSGAGNIDLDIDAPKFSTDISGAGDIKLKGQIKDGSISISGAGSAHCYDLLTENLTIDISGMGSADVFASKTLNAQISGAGSISYKGTATVTKQVSGMGSIKKAD